MRSLAIIGPCATGKSTLAKIVSQELNLPARGCGEAVRQRARELGVPVGELPDSEHHAVDAQTVDWIRGSAPCIVEGRFLDHVLRPLASQITLVELDTASAVRCQRQGKRTGHVVTPDDLAAIDNSELSLRSRLYGGMPIKACVALQTSELSVDECVQMLLCLLKTR